MYPQSAACLLAFVLASGCFSQTTDGHVEPSHLPGMSTESLAFHREPDGPRPPAANNATRDHPGMNKKAPSLEGPHSTDPLGDSNQGPWSDILDAWMAIEDGELAVHWVVARLDSSEDIPLPPTGSNFGGCYNLDFWINDRYVALFSNVNAGTLTATFRHQYLTDNGQLPYEMGTHHVDNGNIDVEISPGSPAQLTARYDSGIFPLEAGDELRWETKSAAHSCFGGPTKTADAFTPAAPFIVPQATWRPPPSGNLYTDIGVGTGLVLNDCVPPALPGAKCIPIRPEDRGAAYVFSTLPPIPVSNVQGTSLVSFYFMNETSDFIALGEPGGIPRRATQFYFSSNVPVAQWELRIE
jgi:hypothetical protein